MNTILQNSTKATINQAQISEHVKTYGMMSIPEMLLIDSQIVEETSNQSNLSAVLSRLIECSGDDDNKKLLTRIRNNFDLFKAIHSA